MGRKKSNRVCDIEDCGRKHEAHGYCPMHYERFRKWGDPMGHTPKATHCGKGHEWNASNTYIRPNSSRRDCRSCQVLRGPVRREWHIAAVRRGAKNHGTNNSYINYGCRCKLCMKAHAEYNLAWLRKQNA